MSCLYIFEISSFSVASFAIIFSHSEGCLFYGFLISIFTLIFVIFLAPTNFDLHLSFFLYFFQEIQS